MELSLQMWQRRRTLQQLAAAGGAAGAPAVHSGGRSARLQPCQLALEASHVRYSTVRSVRLARPLLPAPGRAPFMSPAFGTTSGGSALLDEYVRARASGEGQWRASRSSVRAHNAFWQLFRVTRSSLDAPVGWCQFQRAASVAQRRAPRRPQGGRGRGGVLTSSDRLLW